MATVLQLLRAAAALPEEGFRRDGEILLSHCLAQSRTWLYTWPETEVEADIEARYRKMLEERGRGVPVAHLTGCREFWSLPLAVSAHTLIPRPETETLVEWALELTLPERASVVDLGTGSGAIALALAHERPGWQVTAVDASAEALLVAQQNATSLGLDRVQLLHSDWYQALAPECADLLVSNPPYVAEGDPHLGRGDVRFEPTRALVAGQSGLADLNHLAHGAAARLKPGGWLLLEHGFDQGRAVRELLVDAGLHRVETRCDLDGRERISGGCIDAQ